MLGVPENLLERLRQANDQFHQARMHAEGVSSMSTEQRDEMAKSLRAAEKELEDVTREIDAVLASANKIGAQGAAAPTSPPSSQTK